jgi:DNA-binding GntR family transcriptional regulator
MRSSAARTLEVSAHRLLVDAIRRQDPLAARAAADTLVGNTMLAVERVVQKLEGRGARRTGD